MAKKKHTVLKLECAWCGTPMGEKDGQGVEGVSHSICPMCQYVENLKLAQHYVKTLGITWDEAMKKVGVKVTVI